MSLPSASSWCGPNSSLSIDSGNSVPTTCLCFTIQAFVCLFYCITLPYTLYRVSTLLLASHIDAYDKAVDKVIKALSFAQCVLVCCFSLIGQEITLASALSVSVQALAWLVCAYTSHTDARYLTRWPSWYTKLFFFVEFLLLLVTTYAQYTLSSSVLSLVGGVVVSMTAFSLLMVVILKDLCGRQTSGATNEREKSRSEFESADFRGSFHGSNQNGLNATSSGRRPLALILKELFLGSSCRGSGKVQDHKVSSKDFTCITSDGQVAVGRTDSNGDRSHGGKRLSQSNSRESKGSSWSNFSGWSFHSSQMAWGDASEELGSGGEDDLACLDDDAAFAIDVMGGQHAASRPLLAGYDEYERPNASGRTLSIASDRIVGTHNNPANAPLVKSALENNLEIGASANIGSDAANFNPGHAHSRAPSTASVRLKFGRSHTATSESALLLDTSDRDERDYDDNDGVTGDGNGDGSKRKGNRDSSDRTANNSGAKVSSALKRVLDQQKSRLLMGGSNAAPGSNNNLSPRLAGGGPSGAASSAITDPALALGMSLKSGEAQQDFYVTVQRWGLRRDKLAASSVDDDLDGDHDLEALAMRGSSQRLGSPVRANQNGSSQLSPSHGGNSSSANTTSVSISTGVSATVNSSSGPESWSSEVEDVVDVTVGLGSSLERSSVLSAANITTNIANATINVASSLSPSRDPNRGRFNDATSQPPATHANTDIEFEITVRQGSAGRQLSTSAEQEWWTGAGSGALGVMPGAGDDKRQQPQRSGWTVWRTASELMTLHASLVSAYGDLAPRRPKLKSADVQGFLVTQTEIVSDMRAITAFLNALLRSPTQSVALRSFLKINEHSGGSVMLSLDRDRHGDSSDGPSGDLGLGLGLGIGLGPGATQSHGAFGSALASSVAANSSSHGHGHGSGYTYPSGDSAAGDSQPHPQSHATGVNQNQGANASGLALTNDSLSAMEAKGLAVNQQSKWRKLYMNLRVKLKPHEIGVRCRLFEGVVSGAEITTMLIRTGTTADRSYQHARDRGEACAIGQELLGCGLLVAVCSGFEGENDTNDDRDAGDVADGADGFGDGGLDRDGTLIDGGDSSIAAASVSGVAVNANANTNVSSIVGVNGSANTLAGNDDGSRFSDMPGFIYRFLDRSNTSGAVGSCTVFGSFVKVAIPQWSHIDADRDDAVAGDVSRDSLHPSDLYSQPQRSSVVNSNTNANGKTASTDPVQLKGGHIEYLIDIGHAGDNWFTWKRFREFEQLQRSLAKEGIRADIPLPSKTYSGFGGLVSKQNMLESRRLGLEMHLRSTLETVVQSRNENAIRITGEFLDENFNKLRMS